jgi:NAD-specific glutamate dehydrogenase
VRSAWRDRLSAEVDAIVRDAKRRVIQLRQQQAELEDLLKRVERDSRELERRLKDALPEVKPGP